MDLGARAHSPEDVAFLAQAGFAFAELDWKDPDVLQAGMETLAALRARHGIAYLAHGPNEGNPFDLDQIERALQPAVCQLLDLASELGVTLYTQHLWLDPRYVPPELLARKLDVLEVWVAHATRRGIPFCIENLSEHADHFAPAFQRLPGLCTTLDLGHGEILSEPNAAWDMIARFAGRIRHVHLHDNHGGTQVRDDLHLPVGQGRVDFPGILGALRTSGYDAGLCLEIPLAHVLASRDAIQEMWEQA